jgi:hypothetical protein
VSPTDILGYLAAATVLATFCMSTMASLRLLAIGSNILFASFGALAHIYPVLMLHLILLPVNIVRLAQAFGTELPREATRLISAEGMRIDRTPFAGFAAFVRAIPSFRSCVEGAEDDIVGRYGGHSWCDSTERGLNYDIATDPRMRPW